MNINLLAAVPAALALVPAAFAGGSAAYPMNANLKQGKLYFVAACGSCHTLAAARTHGTKGPNLAEEPKSFGSIVEQITYGGEGMPALGVGLSKAQVSNIAAFVVKSTPTAGARDN
jgi:mono/diheme cytochrome c family protein